MTIDELFNKICAELPEGLNIDISLENGAMTAELNEPGNDGLICDGPDDETAEAMLLRFLKEAKDA